MSGIILPNRFPQQPQYPAAIDWSNSLCRNIQAIFNGASVSREPVTGRPWTNVGLTLSTNAKGRAAVCNDASAYASISQVIPPNSPGWTIAAVFDPISYSGFDPTVVGFCSAPQGGTYDRTIMVRSGVPNGYVYDGGSKYVVANGPSTSAGVLEIIVITSTPSTLTIYRKGYAPASVGVANSGYTGYGTPATFCIGAAGNFGSSQSNVVLSLLVNRPWSEIEAKSWIDNPWQIFKAPSRRIWIGASAGGGAQTLTPTLYSNAQTFYSPTVAAGSVTLTPSLFTNAQSFYAPTVTRGAVTLTPTLFTNSNTFYAPTVSRGAVTLTAGLFSNSNTFYGHTLTTTYGLVAALFTNSPSFYAPTVSVGSVTLSPTLFSNATTFYAHTVSQGAAPQELTPTLYSNAQTFYAPTVTAGSVALTATRLDNAQSFYVPVVTISGGPQYLVPGLYSESQTFYSPSVVPGSLTLTATRFDNAESFYAHTVSQSSSEQTIVPSLFIDSQTFYTHTLTGGVATLIPLLYSNDQEFYSATVVNVGVFVIPTARSAQGNIARRRLPQLSTRQRG